MKNHILKGPKFNTYEEALQFGLMYYKTSIVVEIAGTIYSKNVPAMYFVDGSLIKESTLVNTCWVPSHFRACIKKDAAPTTPLEPRQYNEMEKRGKTIS